MLIAQRLAVREFVGLDHSTASLAIAKKTAEEIGFDRFTPVEGDVLNLPFESESFDIAVSWGVLHHTSDPLKSLKELVRVCKPGGCVGVYLYNWWGHWRHNRQIARVSRLGGENITSRFEVAMRLYGKRQVEDMSPSDIASFYDKYCHPHKSDHTYGETLEWFDDLGLHFSGSYPPLLLKDTVGCLQHRASLADEFPIAKARDRYVVGVAQRLPHLDADASQYGRPSLFHRALWQAVYAWMGRHGGYSMGSALGARKR